MNDPNLHPMTQTMKGNALDLVLFSPPLQPGDTVLLGNRASSGRMYLDDE